MTVTPEQVVDAANAAFGRHHGTRALHAKGILVKGTFTASPEAAQLTTAAHMRGEPVPCTFRFSNASGDPRSPDFLPDLRGFAIKFHLPDGERTDIVSVSARLFATRTPEVFAELLRAQGAGSAAAIRMPILIARHPWLLPALLRTVPAMRPPSSYAAIRYHGQHAFKWIDPEGRERFVRYTLMPATGIEPHLPLRAARRRGRGYLQEELEERLAAGPVEFTFELQIAEPGDPVDDPSREWPQDRRRVAVGTFELTGLEAEGDLLVFDPTRVTSGIELSDDRVLRFRAPAYGESVRRRTA